MINPHAEGFLEAAEEVENHVAGRQRLLAAEAICAPVHQWTKDEVRSLRQQLGYSLAFFGKALAVSNKTVEAWESGRNPVPGPVCRLLSFISLNPKEGFQKMNIVEVRSY